MYAHGRACVYVHMCACVCVYVCVHMCVRTQDGLEEFRFTHHFLKVLLRGQTWAHKVLLPSQKARALGHKQRVQEKPKSTHCLRSLL